MIMGESRNPDKADLFKLANHFKVKKVKEIIQQVEESVANWKGYLRCIKWCVA